MKKYLEPTYKCESDSKEIKRLVRKIVGKRKGRDAVISIFCYVRDRIKYDIVDVVGAKKVLKRRPKRAVCIDKANLMIALCRASGIPARYVAADVVLKTKNGPISVKHMYVEVFYNRRWHKLDPSFGKSSSHFISPSKFEKIPNWKKLRKKGSKETRFTSLSWFIPILAWFMYRGSPSMLKIKSMLKKTNKWR